MPKIRLLKPYQKPSGRILPVGTEFEVTVEFATEMVKEKKALKVYQSSKAVRNRKKV
jgi:hypothetical protein